MKKTVKQLKSQRQFSEEFKRGLVSEYERGESSVGELSKRYKIHLGTLYRWIHQYSVYQRQGYVIVEKSQSRTEELKTLRSHIRELEQRLGQKQLKIEYLEKLIEIAEASHDISIKKNSDPKSYFGSANTPKQ